MNEWYMYQPDSSIPTHFRISSLFLDILDTAQLFVVYDYIYIIYIYDIYYVQLRVCLYSDTLTHIETQTFSHQLLNTVIRSSQNQWFRCGFPDIRVFGGPSHPGAVQLLQRSSHHWLKGTFCLGRPWKTSLFDALETWFPWFPWNISFSSLSCMSIGRHLESPSARWLTRIWNPRTSCWRPTRRRDGAISHERKPGRTAVEHGERESETSWCENEMTIPSGYD